MTILKRASLIVLILTVLVMPLALAGIDASHARVQHVIMRLIGNGLYEFYPTPEVSVEVGDAETTQFKPHVRLNRWNGECYLDIEPAGSETEIEVETEGEKVKTKYKVKQGEYELELESEFYALPPNEQYELGGFEFETILQEEPPTNQLVFDIETQGLVFYYQPPLTQEEIDEGAQQPENVAGSYAVYHESKRDYISGQTNYRAGKAFHIFRPRIEDANGNSTWGDLNISNGTLTVTIPWEFLKNAAYPVRHAAGLTFGYTSQGASSIRVTDDIVTYQPYSSSGSGPFASITAYVENYLESGFKGGLYRASDNTLLVGTQGGIAPGTSAWTRVANYERVGQYTELDPYFDITMGPYRITVGNLRQFYDAYVYDDKGADHFSGSFEHWIKGRFDVDWTSTYTWYHFWALTNVVDDWQGIKDASGDGLSVRFLNNGGTQLIRLTELYAGTEYVTDYVISFNTVYYLRIERDETVGTYGTLYCEIYSSYEDRLNEENVLDVLSLTLHEKEDFRYIFPALASNVGYSWESWGWCERLELREDILEATDYYVALWADDITLWYDAAGPNISYKEDVTWPDDWPDPISWEEHSTRQYSIYATYTSGPTVIPTVTTQAATLIEETTATGNGNITNLGGENCDERGVEWDVDSGVPYSYSATDSGDFGTGTFTKGMTSLSPGALYYYRAKAHNSAGWGYGGEETFLTKPNSPTSFVATPGDTQVSLSWTKGTGAEFTIIRGKIGSYPTNYDTDTDVYSGTGTNTVHTGLTNDDHWYYRAWSKTVEGGYTRYSDYYAQEDAIPSSSYPITTTGNATSLTTTTAVLNGTLTSLGNYTPVYVFFQYGATPSYGTNTAEQTRTSTGSFDQQIGGLSPNTTYNFRSAVKYDTSYVYGANQVFQTAEVGPPTATTNAAADITTSGATLQGTLTSLGDYSPVYVSFEYGLNTAYGTTTADQTKTATGGFGAAIGGLTPSTTYHFRVRVRYDSTYAYGADKTFITTTLGVPSVVTNEAVNETSSAATLQGTLNGLGDYSPVYVSFEWGLTDNYGVTTAEQTKTTTGGFYQDISELEAGTTYHFRARVRYGSSYLYGSDATFATTTEGEAGVDPPDVLRIDDVKVFSSYFGSGDQLYVIAYRIIYSAGDPVLDVGDYFDLQLLDGAVLRAQVPVKMWGYKPGSIYLNAGSALTWSGSYTVKIVGDSSKWETPPSCTRDLTAGDWQGSDLTQLDTWVVSTAVSLQSYYNSEMVTYTTAGIPVLSAQGGVIFNMGIPGLSSQRPHLFSAWSEYIQPEWQEHPRTYEESLDPETKMGGYIYNLLEDAADLVDMEPTTFGGVAFGILWLAVAVIIGVMLGNGIVGLGLASPVLLLGAWFGLIPLALLMVAAGIFVVYTILVIWVKGV